MLIKWQLSNSSVVWFRVLGGSGVDCGGVSSISWSGLAHVKAVAVATDYDLVL